MLVAICATSCTKNDAPTPVPPPVTQAASGKSGAMAPQQEPLTADAVIAEMNKTSPADYVKTHGVNSPVYQNIMAQIESGDAGWLNVAQKLRAVTDAGATEAIDISVARALPKAPAAVIALANTGFPIDKICTSPFIEPAAGVEAGYNTKAVAAIETLPADVRKSETAQSCLKNLLEIKARLSK
jgi:hypothetical protein